MGNISAGESCTLGIIESHLRDVHYARKKVKFLIDFTSDVEKVELFIQSNGIPILLTCLHDHAADNKLHRYACLVLGNVAKVSTQAFLDSGCIEMILSMVLQSLDLPFAVVPALDLFAHLAGNAVICPTLMQEGGPQKVVTVMRAREADSDVQTSACGTLRALAANGSIRELMDSGCVACIMGAKRRFPYRPPSPGQSKSKGPPPPTYQDLHANANKALVALAAEEAYRPAMIEAGSLEMLKAAFSCNDLGLLAPVLRSVAETASQRQACLYVPLLLKVSREHHDDDSLRRLASRALVKLVDPSAIHAWLLDGPNELLQAAFDCTFQPLLHALLTQFDIALLCSDNYLTYGYRFYAQHFAASKDVINKLLSVMDRNYRMRAEYFPVLAEFAKKTRDASAIVRFIDRRILLSPNDPSSWGILVIVSERHVSSAAVYPCVKNAMGVAPGLNAQSLASAVKILGNLASQRSTEQGQILEMVLSVMNTDTHRSDEAIQEAGVYALYQSNSCPPNELFRAMRAFPANQNIWRHASALLFGLASDHGVWRRLLRMGSAELIKAAFFGCSYLSDHVVAMLRHSAPQAARLLANLFIDNGPPANALHLNKLSSLLVDLLKAHIDEQSVATQTCLALQPISRVGIPSLNAECIVLVTRAMSTHPSCTQLQAQACALLHILCTHEPCASIVANEACLEGLGVASRLPATSDQALGVLLQLVQFESIRLSLPEQGKRQFIQMVAETMKSHTSLSRTTRACSIFQLFAQHPAYHAVLMGSGCVPLLMGAMEAHSFSTVLLRVASQALVSLASNGNLEEVRKAGPKTLLQAAVRCYPEDHGLLLQLLRRHLAAPSSPALHFSAPSPLAQLQPSKAGTLINDLAPLLRSADGDEQLNACRILGSLSSIPLFQPHLVRICLHDLVALIQHRPGTELERLSLDNLIAIASDEASQPAMLAAGCFPLMMRVMQARMRLATGENQDAMDLQERTLEEKRRAEQQRDEALAAKQVADNERDAALQARREADEQRDRAIGEKGNAEQEMRAALEAKGLAEQQRDSVLEEKRRAEQARDVVEAAKNQAERERDRALAEERVARHRMEAMDAVSATYRVHIGCSLGSYRPQEHLGSGAYGTAFRAHDVLQDNREVCLKFAFNWLGIDRATLIRSYYAAELQVLARLPPHPGIPHPIVAFLTTLTDEWIRLIPAGRGDARDFATVQSYMIVMPFRGQRLTEERFRALTPLQLVDVFVQLLRIIVFLEDHHLVHCDIKFDNILVQDQPDGSFLASLIDFGLAHFGMARTYGAGEHPWGNELTKPPNLKYLLAGDRIDYTKADSYALAKTLCGLFYGGDFNNEEPPALPQWFLRDTHPLVAEMARVLAEMLRSDLRQRLSARDALQRMTPH